MRKPTKKLLSVLLTLVLVLPLFYALTAVAAPMNATVQTSGGDVNLWKTAKAFDSAKNSLAKIPNGTKLGAVEKGGAFTQITYKGQTGFIQTKYLSFTAIATPTPTGPVPAPTADPNAPKPKGGQYVAIANTTGGDLNVWKEPGRKGGKVETVANKTEFPVAQNYDNGFTFVTTKAGKQGWVATSYLKAKNPPLFKPGSEADVTGTPKWEWTDEDGTVHVWYDFEAYASTTGGVLNIWADEGLTKKLATVKNGAKIGWGVNYDNGLTMVGYEDDNGEWQTGWVRTKYVKGYKDYKGSDVKKFYDYWFKTKDGEWVTEGVAVANTTGGVLNAWDPMDKTRKVGTYDNKTVLGYVVAEREDGYTEVRIDTGKKTEEGDTIYDWVLFRTKYLKVVANPDPNAPPPAPTAEPKPTPVPKTTSYKFAVVSTTGGDVNLWKTAKAFDSAKNGLLKIANKTKIDSVVKVYEDGANKGFAEVTYGGKTGFVQVKYLALGEKVK